MAILRIGQVCKETGLGRTTIWRKERAGDFPQRIRLGAAAVGWSAEEVEAWLATRPRGMAGQPQAVGAATVAGG